MPSGFRNSSSAPPPEGNRRVADRGWPPPFAARHSLTPLFRQERDVPTSGSIRPVTAEIQHRVVLRRFGSGGEARGVEHESREVHGTGARLRAGGAVAGASRRPSAVHARAHPESPARRRGGPCRRPHRQGGRQFARGAAAGRARALQAAEGAGLRGGTALHGADHGAGVRQRREDRAEGGRFVRDRRAAAARAGDGEGRGGGQDPGRTPG